MLHPRIQDPSKVFNSQYNLENVSSEFIKLFEWHMSGHVKALGKRDTFKLLPYF